MLGFDLISVHGLAAELAVDGVQVQAVLARYQRERLIKVRAEFIGIAGLAGVVAGDSQPPTQDPDIGLLEAADVIALPAMQGNRDPR